MKPAVSTVFTLVLMPLALALSSSALASDDATEVKTTASSIEAAEQSSSQSESEARQASAEENAHLIMEAASRARRDPAEWHGGRTHGPAIN